MRYIQLKGCNRLFDQQGNKLYKAVNDSGTAKKVYAIEDDDTMDRLLEMETIPMGLAMFVETNAKQAEKAAAAEAEAEEDEGSEEVEVVQPRRTIRRGKVRNAPKTIPESDVEV